MTVHKWFERARKLQEVMKDRNWAANDLSNISLIGFPFNFYD